MRKWFSVAVAVMFALSMSNLAWARGGHRGGGKSGGSSLSTGKTKDASSGRVSATGKVKGTKVKGTKEGKSGVKTKVKGQGKVKGAKQGKVKGAKGGGKKASGGGGANAGTKDNVPSPGQ
jgi:hypothetical protein